jgi:hypothetical protein
VPRHPMSRLPFAIVPNWTCAMLARLSAKLPRSSPCEDLSVQGYKGMKVQNSTGTPCSIHGHATAKRAHHGHTTAKCSVNPRAGRGSWKLELGRNGSDGDSRGLRGPRKTHQPHLGVALLWCSYPLTPLHFPTFLESARLMILAAPYDTASASGTAWSFRFLESARPPICRRWSPVVSAGSRGVRVLPGAAVRPAPVRARWWVLQVGR